MRSKADETLVIVETLICPLQIFFNSCCNCMVCRIVSFIENEFVEILIISHVIILKIF